MKATIKYFLSNITAKNQKLAVKQILVDKPWALIDSDGEIQKLIFKDDNGLILSKNGKVVTGTWEYFPNSRALFIDRGTDKILLQDQYIDENILLMKRDGTDDEYFALANENTIPTYNVSWYLLKKHYESQEITALLLKNHNILLIHNKLNPYNDIGSTVELIDKDRVQLPILDGKYISNTLNTTVVIKNQHITDVLRNSHLKTISGKSFTIEGPISDVLSDSIDRTIYAEGELAQSQTIQFQQNEYIIVDNGIIKKTFVLVTHDFVKIGKVQLQQNKRFSISEGDQVYKSDIYPVPDGKYRKKGTIVWIKFRNNQVV